MRRGNSAAVEDQLRRLLCAGSVGTLSDEQLLERFATDGMGGGEAAFEVLMTRHGPMVLRACRAVLTDPHAAEDAFQATFMILMRKAGSLWVRDSLAPWLHGVAVRVSTKAKVAAACRGAREKPMSVHPSWTGSEGRAEIAAVVHEEVGRLPEKYRIPVVLCHLEGRSHEDAARSLAWPVGTVRGRLSRARDLLRFRLTRRGFAPAAVALGSLLISETATALPCRLTTAVIVAARKVRAGFPSGTVSEAVAQLIEEEWKTMTMTKLKMAGAMLFAGVLVVGAGAMAQPDGVPVSQGRAADAPNPSANDVTPSRRISDPANPKTKVIDDEAKNLLAEMIEGEAATKLVEERAELVKGEKMALEALLKKYNYGVPPDLKYKISPEEEKAMQTLEKAKLRLETLYKANFELFVAAGRGEMAALRLMKRYPGLLPNTEQPIAPAPTPVPAEHERRLNELERKFDRVLEAIDGLKREPRW